MEEDMRWRRTWDEGGQEMKEDMRWRRTWDEGGHEMKENMRWRRTWDGGGHEMKKNMSWRRTYLKIVVSGSHEDFCRVWFVCAIVHVDVELGGPGDETMANILGHCLVLLQLLQEDVLVEVTDVLQVCKYHRFLPKRRGLKGDFARVCPNVSVCQCVILSASVCHCVIMLVCVSVSMSERVSKDSIAKW